MFTLMVVLKQFLVGIAVFYACIAIVSDSVIQRMSDDTVYVTHGNLYDVFFREPFESQVVIFPNGQFYAFTVHQEYTVGVSAGFVINYIKKDGQTIKNAIIIIHNHPIPGPFSPADKGNCRDFRHGGFTGDYMIYYPFSQKVDYLDDKCTCTQKDN